ncbi:MAG: hypothetical protein QOE54_940 [Streptosporangiaceae bacterium]|jgi:hypothetical protein|nr:hypothetical protein [Streptosporangiaceae bacterium]MDX6428574.1 hypothetical protein [Streptosporangiaceae bacterium]
MGTGEVRVANGHSRRHGSLESLGLAIGPLSNPLTYPGRMAGWPGLLLDDVFLRVSPLAGTPLGRWPVAGGNGSAGPDVQLIDNVLRGLGRPAVSERHVVVSIGSNAAPAQIHAKFTSRNVQVALPMIRAEVHGIRAGVSAHVSRPGYLPATPVADPDHVCSLVLLWLDDDQLAALDDTEPNYHRVRLPSDSFTVSLPSGERLYDPYCYVSRHGCIVDGQGVPRPLRSQHELISDLLAGSPDLRRLCGVTPLEWLTSTSALEVRDRVRAVLRQERLVLHQAEFADLPTA